MEATPQQLEELVREVRLMREAQKKYFRSRTTTALDEARYHEGIVDAHLKKLPEPGRPQQATLFG